MAKGNEPILRLSPTVTSTGRYLLGRVSPPSPSFYNAYFCVNTPGALTYEHNKEHFTNNKRRLNSGALFLQHVPRTGPYWPVRQRMMWSHDYSRPRGITDCRTLSSFASLIAVSLINILPPPSPQLGVGQATLVKW
jgi:hypothetical protein